MIRWREAWERCKDSTEFQRYFASAKKITDFRYLAYGQQFNNVAAGTGSNPITPGAISGPALQNFPSGAIILGITAAAAQAQTVTGSFQYGPSCSPGRRDLFAINLSYTNNELITPGGPVLAEALLGNGEDTLFPAREIIVPPSQGLLCSMQSYTIAPALVCHVVYHTMVPKVAS